MNYKQTIAQIDQLQEALTLAIEIQNKGIATVFFDYSGHINSVDIKLYAPQWISGNSATKSFRIYCDQYETPDENQEVIDTNGEQLFYLRNVLINGIEESEIEKAQRAQRQAQYLQLKKEFEAA